MSRPNARIKQRNRTSARREFRIAVVQAGTVLGSLQSTLKKLEHYCGICAAQNAELAVFPEAFVGGYPKGMTFGVSTGIRTSDGRKLFRKYAHGAICIPGPEVRAMGRLARKYHLHLVVGVVERSGGTLYCVILYFSADGHLLGRHRKLVPTAAERVIWGPAPTGIPKIVATPLAKIGGLICWENMMPLARQALYEQGVEVLCTPTVDDRDVWLPTLQHIAREGRCFVASSCQFIAADSYPLEWLKDAVNLPSIPIRGGSCIVGPLGEMLTEPVYGRETVLSAAINLDQLIEAKFDFDVVGHYARPDLLRLVTSPESGCGHEMNVY